MTTCAMTAGMLPMALALGESGQQMRPWAAQSSADWRQPPQPRCWRCLRFSPLYNRVPACNQSRSIRAIQIVLTIYLRPFQETHKMNRAVFITLLAMNAAVPGFIAGCYSSTSAKQQAAESATGGTVGRLRVAASRLERKTLRLESVQPGWIEAFEQTPLLCKLPAYVKKLHVDIGDRVEADQLLVELWIPELEDELRQKEAAVVQTQAEIEQAAAAVQAAEAAVATALANINLMEAGTARADADYARWQSQYERISKLVADGSLDRKLQDETQDSLKAAEAAQLEARARVASAKATLLETQAKAANAKANQSVTRARLGNAQADLSRQKTLLKYTQIHAPYDGVVTERNIARGDFVQPAGAAMAKPLMSVARTDVVRVFVDVPEMESPQIERGRPGYISVQAIPEKIVEGKVTRTSWALGGKSDLANRTGSS